MWCKKYEDFDFETVLAGDPVFQGWIKGQESQILLLHGESHMRHAYHWLSAAALGMVSSLVEKAEAPESKPLSAFLHPDPWLPNGARVPQGALISSLISQILEHCPTIAEDFAFFQYLEARIQSSEWFDDTTCENQYDVLGQLLEHRKECYVILDRLDCCDCPLAIVLQNFLKFIGECQNVIVKIFIVVKDEPEMRDIVSPLKSKLRVIRKDQGKRRRQS